MGETREERDEKRRANQNSENFPHSKQIAVSFAQTNRNVLQNRPTNVDGLGWSLYRSGECIGTVFLSKVE